MDARRVDVVKQRLVWKKSFLYVFRISFFTLCASILFYCCTREVETISVAVINTNAKATALSIRGISIKASDLRRLQIRLVKPGARAAILGDFRVAGREVVFEPLVPFSPGLSYEILLDDIVLSEIKIAEDQSDSPTLLAIYPSADTLPENLLKMYFHFSMPMVEGQSLKHIRLIRGEDDTVSGTFLDLQPELWNADGTVLTLWLDPGRIKRDLIPNRELGSPLKANDKYTLHVASSWRSKNGKTLSTETEKTFFVRQRDDLQPNLGDWKLTLPPSNTRHEIEIHFPEPLDRFLLNDVISIRRQNHKIEGDIEISANEGAWKFRPIESWEPGSYVLSVESKLEDLSGNNLNHPFDRLIDNDSETNIIPVRTIDFKIE